MLFFWKDKTAWSRIKASCKVRIKFLLPLLIINIILWEIVLTQNFEQSQNYFSIKLFLVSFMSAGVIYTFISIFKQFPHENILDSYSPLKKNILYLIDFFLACFGLYFILTKLIFV